MDVDIASFLFAKLTTIISNLSKYKTWVYAPVMPIIFFWKNLVMLAGWTVYRPSGCQNSTKLDSIKEMIDMTICEATSYRIAELCKQKNVSGYYVSYKAGMPASTYKSIVNGKSKNPGIVNINKIADGLGITIREFYDSELFDNLDPDE